MTLSEEHRLYLLGRGITPPTAEVFGIHSSDRGLLIPFRDGDETVAEKVYVPDSIPKIKWNEPLDGMSPPIFPSPDDAYLASLIVEGEFDAIVATQELGEPVASGSGGASTWKDEWSVYFSGRDVTLLYDNDDPGQHGAVSAAHSLHTAGASVHIAKWPEGLTKGYDVSEFFRDGGTAVELRAIISGAAPYLPPGLAKGLSEFLKAKTVVKPMLIEAVWPSQAIGFIAGPPKSLKSWMALELAMAISTGNKFLNRYISHPARVLLVQQESSFYAFQRRVEAVSKRYGATHELFILSNVGFDLTDETQSQKLEEEVRRVRPALLILDPFASFFSGDENSAKEVGGSVRLLRKWRDEYETAICIVHHSNKGNGDRAGLRMRGSSALYAAAEVGIWMERKDDESSLSSRVKMELKEGEAPWPFEVALDRESTLLNVVTAGETLKRNLDIINHPKTVPFWNQHESWETP